MSRARRLSPLPLVLLAAAPATAHAGWSAPLTVPGSTGASAPVVAVDGRGDVAVAWTSGTRTSVAVRVAMRRAGSARWGSKTLTERRGWIVRGLTLVLDRRGRATVAWVDQPRPSGHRTVRAASRTAAGRWSAVQAVGRSSSFLNAQPRLAAAADGSVVLAFNAGVRAAPGVAVAWRTATGRFGAIGAVPGRRMLTEPVLRVDGGGRVLLAGTRDCDRRSSAGVLHTATVRGRRFGAARVVAPAPARHVQMVLDGGGTPVFAWLRGMCSTTEDLTGIPAAATLRGRSATAPVTLDRAPAFGLVLAGARGGGTASWVTYPATQPGPLLLGAAIAADGTAAPAAGPPEAWVPVASDASGDQLVRQVPDPEAPTGAFGARPGGAVAVAAAPVRAAGFPWTASAAGAADGRALAALAPSDVGVSRPALVTAVWRP